jgi:hypothetical protein
MFQMVLDLVLIVVAILFLRWLYHKWFSKAEKEESDILISKKVELRNLRQKKEDLEETVGVTKEVNDLQRNIELKEEELKRLRTT